MYLTVSLQEVKTLEVFINDVVHCCHIEFSRQLYSTEAGQDQKHSQLLQTQ